MTDIFPEDFEGEEEETLDEEEELEAVENDEEPVESAEDFADKYGFSHDCQCGDDWASGNLAVVSVCYVNMIREALDVLAGTREELKAAEQELGELRIQLVDDGA